MEEAGDGWWEGDRQGAAEDQGGAPSRKEDRTSLQHIKSSSQWAGKGPMGPGVSFLGGCWEHTPG